MTELIREKAQATLKEVEDVTSLLLPEPKGELILPEISNPVEKEAIESRMAELDMSDTQSIIRFGSGAQSELQEISQDMLRGVKNKDVGPAGASLREMIGSIRGFSTSELNPNRKRSWWERLTGAAKDDLERRVHDLKLTRQVTMQSLPSIRLVQENDKSLVTKINSTLVNTVPLWETQLAQAVTINRSMEAAETVKDANDLTNELLKSNADNLRQANTQVRTQMERGVFDIDAVKAANDSLIATIEESLQIADAGKARRASAESELIAMEQALKDALGQAKAASQ